MATASTACALLSEVQDVLAKIQAAVRTGKQLLAQRLACEFPTPLGLTAQDVGPTHVVGGGAESTVLAGQLHGLPVAVKKYAIRHAEDLDRFRKELLVLASLKHPCIIQLVGARVLPPDYFLVMPLEGSNLHTKLYEQGWRPKWVEVLTIACDLASALQHVHAHGVVHRDLKPTNLLQGLDGRVKLVDFGIMEYAHVLEQQLKVPIFESKYNIIPKIARKPSGGFHKRQMAGTLEYMAPEVLLKTPHSVASDAYAFAVTINELITAVVPFSDCTRDNPQCHTVLEMGYGRQELASAVAGQGLRPTVPNFAPPGYKELMEDCWNMDPSQRPHFAAVQQRLEAILQGLSAWSPTTSQPVKYLPDMSHRLSGMHAYGSVAMGHGPSGVAMGHGVSSVAMAHGASVDMGVEGGSVGNAAGNACSDRHGQLWIKTDLEMCEVADEGTCRVEFAVKSEGESDSSATSLEPVPRPSTPPMQSPKPLHMMDRPLAALPLAAPNRTSSHINTGPHCAGVLECSVSNSCAKQWATHPMEVLSMADTLAANRVLGLVDEAMDAASDRAGLAHDVSLAEKKILSSKSADWLLNEGHPSAQPHSQQLLARAGRNISQLLDASQAANPTLVLPKDAQDTSNRDQYTIPGSDGRDNSDSRSSPRLTPFFACVAGHNRNNTTRAMPSWLVPRPCASAVCPSTVTSIVGAFVSTPESTPFCPAHSSNTAGVSSSRACPNIAPLSHSNPSLSASSPGFATATILTRSACTTASSHFQSSAAFTQPSLTTATQPRPSVSQACSSLSHLTLPLPSYCPHVTAGIFETINNREHMEDRSFAELNLEGSSSTHVFAVFDGHRGGGAAHFAAQHFMQVLQQQRAALGIGWEQSTGNTGLLFQQVLSSTFIQLDSMFYDMQEATWQERVSRLGPNAGPRPYPGCTALAALLLGTRMLLANAGDCRAVVSRSGCATQLTMDHTAAHMSERLRLTTMGAKVEMQHGTWRIGRSGLQVTRSIGDFDEKPHGVISVPEITHYDITPDDEFLVLASDGLWDVMGIQEAVGIIMDTVKQPYMCAQRLAAEAVSRRSMDNITVIVIFLQPVPTLEEVFSRTRMAHAFTPTFSSSRPASGILNGTTSEANLATMDEVYDLAR